MVMKPPFPLNMPQPWPGLAQWNLLDKVLLILNMPPISGEVRVPLPLGNLPFKEKLEIQIMEIPLPSPPNTSSPWIKLLVLKPLELLTLPVKLLPMSGELRVQLPLGNLPFKEKFHTIMETQLPSLNSMRSPLLKLLFGKPLELLPLPLNMPPMSGEVRVSRSLGNLPLKERSHMIMETQLPSLLSMRSPWIKLLVLKPLELLPLPLNMPPMYGEVRVPRLLGSQPSSNSRQLMSHTTTVMKPPSLNNTPKPWPGLARWKEAEQLRLTLKKNLMSGEVKV